MVIPTVNVRKLMMRVDDRSRFYAIALETQVSPQLMLRVPCPCPVEETFPSHSTERSSCEPVVPCEASSEEG